MTDRGTYVEHEGRPAVRFVRHYRHPAERVWAAVSEPRGTAAGVAVAGGAGAAGGWVPWQEHYAAYVAAGVPIPG